MLFNSYGFLLAFLPIVLLLWWNASLGVQTRLAALVLASYFFYGWWDYRFVSLLIFSTIVDYCVGGRLAAATTEWGRRGALIVSMTVNLGLLGFFKYSGFLAKSVNAVTEAIHGGGSLPVWDIILPVGISFYTFQTMSYSIDIYLGKAKPAKSMLHFAAYVSMFPQLIAGPIVRYRELEDQLREVKTTPDWSLMANGIFFFVAGLGQKLLLADIIASRIDPLFSDYESLQFVGSWYVMLGYTCQLYFDFAGYSNMAVGLGMMLGFRFPQNFDSPYRSANISDFWRRWHMTLSGWLRDYLFVPLGGNRHGKLLTLRNLFIVMFLGGLWHGAGWTFVCWGIYHGLLLVIHRVFRESWGRPLPTIPAVAITFIAVVFGWVLFRASDLAMAEHLCYAMVGGYGFEPNLLQTVGGFGSVVVLTSLLGGIFLLPNLWQVRFRPSFISALAIAMLLIVCVLRLDSQSPFLYFQF